MTPQLPTLWEHERLLALAKGRDLPTRERYELTNQLVAKGLMDRDGTITAAGRMYATMYRAMTKHAREKLRTCLRKKSTREALQ